MTALTAAALLFGLTGEPYDPPSPSPEDKALFCPLAELLDSPNGSVLVIDISTGKATRTVHCRT